MILVIGGSGSGKSAYAEQLVLRCGEEQRRYYLATMQVYGAEGREKVARHRKLREGKGFFTVEQPRDISACIPVLRKEGRGVVLLECLSNLIANEMFPEGTQADGEAVAEKVVRGIIRLQQETSQLVIVTNNVFEDGICYDASTMAYIRALAEVNRRLAERADAVVEVIVGIPVQRKGRLPV